MSTPAPARRNPLMDEIRAETAAIYSHLVPEHHGHSRPLPSVLTNWERARLDAAARTLAKRRTA